MERTSEEKYLVGDLVVISEDVADICKKTGIKNDVDYSKIDTAGIISENEIEKEGVIVCRVCTSDHGTIVLPIAALEHLGPPLPPPKITLEDILGYLPYGLKIKVGGTRLMLSPTHGLHQIAIEMVLQRNDLYKPILKPINEIFEKIDCVIEEDECKGQELEVILMQKMDKDGYTTSLDKVTNLINKRKFDQLPHWLYQELLKRHYDINNLIGRNLAVDYKSLNEQHDK